MRYALFLVVFIPPCAVLGGHSTFDSGMAREWGLFIGAVGGIVVAVMFGRGWVEDESDDEFNERPMSD